MAASKPVAESSAREVYALDLATQTGWARWVEGGRITSGTVSFAPKKKDGHPADRFIKLHAWLCDNVEKADLVVYEMPHQRGGAATRALVGMAMTLETWARRHEIRCEQIHSGTIKKYVTGKGKAEKAEVAAAVKLALPGITPADDNESDALALLLCGLERFVN